MTELEKKQNPKLFKPQCVDLIDSNVNSVLENTTLENILNEIKSQELSEDSSNL